MKRVYILEDLDCAHCAAKIETDVAGLAGVESAAISLMAQKLTVNCSEDIKDTLTADVKKIVAKYEPDVEVIEK